MLVGKQKVLNLLIVDEEPDSIELAVAEVLECQDPKVCESLTCECSVDRGISFVREKVTPLSKQTCLAGQVRVVIFYDAHLLTYEAQSALRRCIENQQGTSRFVLVTTKPQSLMEPIRSRLVPTRKSRASRGHYQLSTKYKSLISRALDGSVDMASAFRWADRCVSAGLCALDVLERAAARRGFANWDTLLSLNEMVVGCTNEKLAAALSLYKLNCTLRKPL